MQSKRNYRYLWSLTTGIFVIAGNLLGGWWVAMNTIFSLGILAVLENFVPDDKSNELEEESWFPDGYKPGYTLCPDGPVTGSCTSPEGAIGIMQVMPRDGIAANVMCDNGPCFSGRPSTADLRDPEFNIKFGCRFLAEKIAQEGSVLGGLKAYGPANKPGYYANTVLGYYRDYGDGK